MLGQRLHGHIYVLVVLHFCPRKALAFLTVSSIQRANDVYATSRSRSMQSHHNVDWIPVCILSARARGTAKYIIYVR